MGGNAIGISEEITFIEAAITFEWFKKNILPKLDLEEKDIEILGSYGKKLSADLYGDIDIAVLITSLKFPENQTAHLLSQKLQYLGYITKLNLGFRIVSFGCPIGGDPSNGFAQLDLMLTPSLEWSKFICYSPNYKLNESRYRGFYRNILLMAIITETQKNIIKTTPDGGIEEIEVNILRYPRGIYRVRKNFMGKKGLVKNGKNVEGFDNFVTNSPIEVTKMTVGDYKPEDINTFEKLWSILLSPNFKWINRREDITKRYFECLDEQGFPIPKELLWVM